MHKPWVVGRSMMIVRGMPLALWLIVIAAPSLAHGPERGPNGGQIQDVGDNHVELVVKDNELMLYLFDTQGEPASAKGATATATVLSGGRQATVAFEASEDNMLRGRGDFTAGPGMKVVVSLTLPGQRTQLTRYAPMD